MEDQNGAASVDESTEGAAALAAATPVKRLNAATDLSGEAVVREHKVTRVLSADQILAAEDIGIEAVDVPEWGGTVYVRAMTALQRERYLDSMRKVIGEGAKATVKTILAFGSAKLVALTVCDQNGNLLFDTSPETVQKLALKSAKAMERVVDVSARLNNLDEDEEKKKKADGKNGSAVLTETSDGSAID